MVTCNTTLSEEKIDEDPLFGSVTFHHVGLIVSAVFGLISVIISLFLIYRHATHYSKPWEQKHIIRILFMIPIYATVSFLSYLYYTHAIYFEVLRDCYEAFAISAFFTLLCHYIADNLHEQKEYFRLSTPKNWLWPLNWFQKCSGGTDKGAFRVPKSGLTWFNIIWVGVFQYCFIRVFFTIVSVASQATGRYCEASLHPAFAHIWVMVFESASVTVAMYCLIQFYYQLKSDLAQYRPFLKILCIKLVIFFSFWQSMLISFLSSSGTLKTSKTLAYPDIKIGIPSMLLCVEMAIFAAMHIFAFSWKDYDLTKTAAIPDTMPGALPGDSGYKGGKYGIKALVDSFNPWDIIKASARGFRWLFVGVRKRHQDPSYQNNTKLSQLDNAEDHYNGPTFAGNGEPAIATVDTSYGGGKKPPGHLSTEEDDREGLLSHVQPSPYSPLGSYGQSPPNAYGHGDLGVYNPDALPQNPTPGSEMTTRPAASYSTENTSYYGRVPSPAAPPSRPSAATEPQWSQQAPYPPAGGEWDMFGGVSSNRPPGRPER